MNTANLSSTHATSSHINIQPTVKDYQLLWEQIRMLLIRHQADPAILGQQSSTIYFYHNSPENLSDVRSWFENTLRSYASTLEKVDTLVFRTALFQALPPNLFDHFPNVNFLLPQFKVEVQHS